MAIKWKTSIKFHNYRNDPPSEETKSEIRNQCDQWQVAGLYSGEVEVGWDPDNPDGYIYHRWWWISEQQANAYVEFAELAYPGRQKTVDITWEEVPD